jgi:hypothetical protein
MRRATSCVAVGLLLAACGGGSSGSGGGGGGGGGGTEIAYMIPATSCMESSTTVSVAGGVIMIALNRTITDACAEASNACVSFKNLQGLGIGVVNYSVGGTAAALTPGTYTLGTTPTGSTGTLAFAGYDQTDATCTSSSSSGSATGSITITSVTGSAIAGSYDVTQDTNHLTGSFNATVCASGAFQGDICSSSSGGGLGGGTCTGTAQCI